MSSLFEPMCIRTMRAKNRFVRSVAHDGYADENGHVTGRQIGFFEMKKRVEGKKGEVDE